MTYTITNEINLQEDELKDAYRLLLQFYQDILSIQYSYKCSRDFINDIYEIPIKELADTFETKDYVRGYNESTSTLQNTITKIIANYNNSKVALQKVIIRD
jgi:hypothetical protein